jgi:protein gp37
MGADTCIEWADHTFNPWIGCTKVSPACDHCYAETLATARLGVAWGPHAERRRTAPSTWRQPLAWNRRAEREARRFRVFCASLADVFDNSVPIEWLVDALDVIRTTPHLTWLLLTKRPQLIGRRIDEAFARLGQGIDRGDLLMWLALWRDNRPPENVWLGTTVENREEMFRRGPPLRAAPAVRHFWSAEPLLGDLGTIPAEIMPGWIITGGESGPKARPSHPDWFRSLRDQCQAAGVAFYFKQWGEWRHSFGHPAGTPGRFALAPRTFDGPIVEIDHYPRQFTAFGSTILERFGKKAAGAMLDGREWREVPDA